MGPVLQISHAQRDGEMFKEVDIARARFNCSPARLGIRVHIQAPVGEKRAYRRMSLADSQGPVPGQPQFAVLGSVIG